MLNSIMMTLYLKMVVSIQKIIRRKEQLHVACY